MRSVAPPVATPAGVRRRVPTHSGRFGEAVFAQRLAPSGDGLLCQPPGVRRRVPMHPGRFLERHYLKPLALTQSAAARCLGVSRRRMHELVHGQRAMSADTALRCARAFGLPAGDWLAMQAEWDAWSAWQAMRLHSPPPAAARG